MSLSIDESRWSRVVFGDVATNINDYFVVNRDGVLPYVAGPHIVQGHVTVANYGSTDDDHFPPTFKRKFHSGDVLLHSRGIEKLAAVDRSGVTGEKLFVLRSLDESRLLQSFLPWLLMGPHAQRHMKDNFTGSVNKFLNWRPLASFEFDLPPLDEQKRIADLLWSVEIHRRALIEAAQTLSATRREWFAETLIAGVERGWTRESIRNLVISGPTNGKSGRANDEERGVPTLSISAIRDGLVRGGASVKYMDVAPGDVSNFVIREDDVLVVRGNGNKQLTGRAGLARGGLPPGCVYPDLLIRLRFDDARLDPAFAVEQWNSSAHAELVQRAKSTNGIWKINGQDIKSHSLVVPPPAAQANMLAQIEYFTRAESVIRSEADALGALRSSILSSIFGGN